MHLKVSVAILFKIKRPAIFEARIPFNKKSLSLGNKAIPHKDNPCIF